MEFNTQKVRYGIKNIAPKGESPQWAVVATYMGSDVQAVAECGDLDEAKGRYQQIRNQPRLAWKAVYVEMISQQQSQEELQVDPLPV